MKLKRGFGLLLALCLAVSVLPAQAETLKTQTVYLEEDLAYVTEAESISLLDDGGVTLKEGHHARWIDRIADLPEYAMAFYEWLEENSRPDGALVDPKKGENVQNSYRHTIAVFEGSVPFSYDSQNCTDDVRGKAATAAALAASDSAAQSAVSYTGAIYSAFDRDHPEVFWLSGESRMGSSLSCSYSYIPNSGQGTASYVRTVYIVLEQDNYDIRAEEYDGKHGGKEIKEEMRKLNEDIREILSGQFPKDGSRMEQLRYLNNWLTTHNEYNTSQDLNGIDHDCRECVSALDGEAGTEGPVCEGYAKAFKVLCDRLEIPCVLENGVAGTDPEHQENHMWNLVRMKDGNWYAVDVTWNDPVAVGGDKKPPHEQTVSGVERESYLLIGSRTKIDGETFAQSHVTTNVVTRNGMGFINGPVLQDEKYVPGNENRDHVQYDFTAANPEKLEVTFEVPEDKKEETYNILLVAYNGSGQLALISMDTVSGGEELRLTMERKGLSEGCTFKAFLLGADMHPIDDVGNWEPET